MAPYIGVTCAPILERAAAPIPVVAFHKKAFGKFRFLSLGLLLTSELGGSPFGQGIPYDADIVRDNQG
jgi:hypothetical protein